MEQIEYLNAHCAAFVIEVNPHKIMKQSAADYLQKYISEVDESVIDEMIESNTIVKVTAWLDAEKVSCIDFHFESAIETVYEAVKNYKP